MPELPEVETVKNQLSPHIIGRTSTKVTLLWDRMVKGQDAAEFVRGIAGQKITDIARHGKYLIVHLNSGENLIIHLKMTGSLLLERDMVEPPKFTRAIIHLDDGQNIYFRDPPKRSSQLLQNYTLFAIIITMRNNDNGEAAIFKMLE